MTIGSRIEAIKQKDARRPGFPGEHLAVLGTGVLLLLTAGRSHSWRAACWRAPPAVRWSAARPADPAGWHASRK